MRATTTVCWPLEVTSIHLALVGCQELNWKVKVKAAQSCQTICHPMDYTVHGILQARILEWVAFPFFRGSFQPRDRTQVFHVTGGFFTSWATGKPGSRLGVANSSTLKEKTGHDEFSPVRRILQEKLVSESGFWSVSVRQSNSRGQAFS